VGKPVEEVLRSAKPSGLTRIMRQVCRTSRARHLKGVAIPELDGGRKGKAGLVRMWDWEIYPLSDAHGRVTHLLNVVLDVVHRPPERHAVSAAQRQAENRRREEASGVLRIFGLAPDVRPTDLREALTERELDVADLVAQGLTNTAIAQELQLSHSTVSSHVAKILAKRAFRSRAQIAAWVVQGRLPRPSL
jgi:DNA-binding CsgD family transcriptional regulator